MHIETVQHDGLFACYETSSYILRKKVMTLVLEL
jgi:hypothetical protein